MKTFYLQLLSTFQAVNFDLSLIKINWKIGKFLKFENTLTSSPKKMYSEDIEELAYLLLSQHQRPTNADQAYILYYRVIALISVNIVPSWDIEGRELAS